MLAAVLSLAFQTVPRDGTAHVTAAKVLAQRLVQAGFPDLLGWELRMIELPENTVSFDFLDFYVWVDPKARPSFCYTIYGTKRPLPGASVPVSIENLLSHQFALTRFQDGSWYASGLDKALISFVAAGQIDAVKGVIERDILGRTPVEVFTVELLHGIAVPRFNEAVGHYQREDYPSAREALVPLMEWLEFEMPEGGGQSVEQRTERTKALAERTLSLAGEIRRRLRGPVAPPFSNEVAASLPIQERIAYLIEHLPEATGLSARPGGARFQLGAIVRMLIEIGEPALPTLREVVKSDPRLTKVAYNRVDGELLYVYSVADVARQVIGQIERGSSPR